MKELIPFTGDSIIDLIAMRAETQPDDVAYYYLNQKEENKVTYAELYQKVVNMAAALQKYGVKGERIVLMHPSGIDYVVAYFSVIFAGAIAVPVYEPRKSSHFNRLESILDDSKPKLLLMSENTAKVTSHELMNKLTAYGAEVLISDNLSVNSDLSEWSPVSLGKDDVVFLQYTSGSTGNPKGVMVSNGNLIHNSRVILNATEPDGEFCCVSWLPPYHDMGLIGGLMQPLFAGYPCVILSPISVIQRKRPALPPILPTV